MGSPLEEATRAVVKRIKDNHWGTSADGKTVTGPEGFTIDLTKCPAGWSNTEGLTDTSIKIGYSLPQSGHRGRVRRVGQAPSRMRLQATTATKGAFTDSNGKTRKVNLITRDDGYDPARTIPIVDEFLDSEKVFAVETRGIAADAEDLRQGQPALRPPAHAVTGHPAVGRPGQPPVDDQRHALLRHRGGHLGRASSNSTSMSSGGKVKVAAS